MAGISARATGGIHPPLGKRVSAPQVNVCSTAGRCPNSWAGIAGTSAGATGGILKSTPTAEVIAPQVVFHMARVLPSSVPFLYMIINSISEDAGNV